jgi:glycosyltransferase involved in cell wall biosynthesis
MHVSFDIVFTISNVARLLPYLRMSLGSIRRQEYPNKLYRTTVVYFHNNLDEDISELAALCRDHNATLVCGRWVDPAFSIARAYNLGARAACRDAVAFLDADVLFHPDMLAQAAECIEGGEAAVIPVGRSEWRPDHKFFKHLTRKRWDKVVKDLPYSETGIGNIIVPRPVVEILNGYDERYYGWGACDSDFHKRVKSRCGAKYLQKELPLAIHMWHKLNPSRINEFTRRNRKLWIHSRGKVRNKGSWGGEKSPRRAVHEGFRLDFAGAEAQHSPYTYAALSGIMATHRPQQIIELGTAEGALTTYFGLLGTQYGIPVHSFDIEDKRSNATRAIHDRLGVHFHEHNVLDNPKKVRRLLGRGLRTYLLCDNGDKPKEVELYGKWLKSGSVLSVHDWLTEVHPDEVAEFVKGWEPWKKDQWTLENIFLATWIIP